MPVWMFWLNLVVALVGAAAWIPITIKLLRRRKIYGRVISRYFNLDKSSTKSFFLFKLAVLVKNKPINLKKVRCDILDEDGNLAVATATTQRLTIFNFEKVEIGGKTVIDGGTRELNVSSEDFLNNRAILLPEENTIGYLFFEFAGNWDRKIRSTTFIFEDFGGGSEKVKIVESKLNGIKLFFDDSIWKPASLP